MFFFKVLFPYFLLIWLFFLLNNSKLILDLIQIAQIHLIYNCKDQYLFLIFLIFLLFFFYFLIIFNHPFPKFNLIYQLFLFIFFIIIFSIDHIMKFLFKTNFYFKNILLLINQSINIFHFYLIVGFYLSYHLKKNENIIFPILFNFLFQNLLIYIYLNFYFFG